MDLQIDYNLAPPGSPYRYASVVDLASADWTTTIPSRALMIGAAGNIKVDTAGGSAGVVIVVPAGEIKIAVTKVYKTGTTATGIVALN